MSAQFHWTPETYLEMIRAEVPRFDELQAESIAAIPFEPKRVLELGIGTGETSRRLIEAYPDAEITGLDSSAEMVFRARELGIEVRLARMEDPLPDGPWDLVIAVLSVHHLDDGRQAGPVSPGPRAIARAGDRRRRQQRDARHSDRPRDGLPGDCGRTRRVVGRPGHVAGGRPRGRRRRSTEPV